MHPLPAVLAFKGPTGLFAFLLTLSLSLGAVAQSPPAVFKSSEPIALAAPASHSMYEGRPASIVINSVQVQGTIVATDPETRPWSGRITPVVIRYPGIDLASGLFQDLAAEHKEPFAVWLAEKWIDRNARCNRVFQRASRSFPWEGPTDVVVLQCNELNRPSKDLKPICSGPEHRNSQTAILRLRWLCSLASNTAPLVYEETSPSLKLGAIALAINPASKERTSISIENRMEKDN